MTIDRINFIHVYCDVAKPDERYRRALVQMIDGLQNDSSAVIPYLALARLEYSLGEKYQPLYNEQHQFKKAEAATICDSILAKFSSSHFTAEAKNLKWAIVEPNLQLTIEDFILPDVPSKLLARYSNFDQVYLQTYHIRPAQYDEFQKQTTDSARLAQIQPLTKSKQWKVALKNEGDFQEHTQEALFPAHELGAYLVVAFADEAATTPLAHAMTQVTRLGIVKLYNPYKKTYQVFDRENGKAIAGASARFLRVNGGYFNRFFTSDEEGMFSLNKSDSHSGLSIYLKKDNDSIRVRNHYLNKDRNMSALDTADYTIEAKLFTDRAIYRPGQELFFKAIVYKSQRQGSKVIPNEYVHLTLYDPNSNFIWADSLKTNEFGSISGKLNLPATGMTGSYYLELTEPEEEIDLFWDALNELDIRHNFRVEEYKRPKFEINFDPVEEAYRYKDSIFVKGQATALAGSQVSNAKLTYKVQRRTIVSYYRYSGSSSYRDDTELVAQGELKTDDEGRFTIPFKALIGTIDTDDGDVQLQYEVSVAVTDLNGETRENDTNVMVAKNPYTVRLGGKRQYEKGPDSLLLPVYINTINDAKIALGGTITIEKLQAPTRIKRSSPWPLADYQAFNKKEHDQLFPHWYYEFEGNQEKWPVARLMMEKPIAEGAETSNKIGDVQNWPSGHYKATFRQQTEEGD